MTELEKQIENNPEIAKAYRRAMDLSDLMILAPHKAKYVRRDEGVVNNTYVKMLEALGYDIELHYVKREE